jgi:hypothetical protein
MTENGGHDISEHTHDSLLSIPKLTRFSYSSIRTARMVLFESID